MACNRLPDSFADMLLRLTEAHNGAVKHGDELPLILNSAGLIGADRAALMLAEDEYQLSRAQLAASYPGRRAAVKSAQDFCLRARDVLQYFLGRTWTGEWLAAGWNGTLMVPQGMAELLVLTNQLSSYFAAHPEQQCAMLAVTAAEAQARSSAMVSADQAVTDAEVESLTRRNVTNAKWTAARKRLRNLCRELAQHLEDMDPRWLWFGFNMPGAPTTPAVPEAIVVAPQSGARLQVSCEPSPGATNYRFYAQRVGVDPQPVLEGSSTEPLFITGPLVAGAEYLIYLSAVNDGAASVLSAPVSAQVPAVNAAA